MVLLSVLCVAASAQFYVPAAQPVAYTYGSGAAVEVPRVALRGAPVQPVPVSANGSSSALQPLFFLGAGCAGGYALFSLLGQKAQPPARRGRIAGPLMRETAGQEGKQYMYEGEMYTMEQGNYMYDKPYAPPGCGREYIMADVRKPLSEYVGASAEFNIGKYLAGEPESSFEPWDPWDLCKLSKVSANNPDVAFLREAELKHGRIAMLAFVGILFTQGDIHLPGEAFATATAKGWPDALGNIAKSNPGIVAQALATIGLVEGVSNTKRGKPGGAAAGGVNWWDGLWFGQREGNPVVPGDLGWDPLKLMPNDPKAADRMRVAEIKNGRLAMMAVMGIFMGYMNTGNARIF